MKLLVISQYYYPEQFRINDICKELVKRGHDVTVLTGIPNYPEGKYYKGYGLTKKRNEIVDGVKIIRIPLIPRGKKPIMLMLNYISFVISGSFWARFTIKKFDKVFIYEVSPMTQAIPGIKYAKRKKIETCMYVMDLWPESIELATGLKNKMILNIIGKIVDKIYRKCNLILTSSKSFIDSISKRGHPKEKIIFWPQYAEAFYKPIDKNKFPITEFDNNKFKIVFAGNIGYAQGLDIVIDTATLLKKDDVGVVFYLIGNGRAKKELQQKVEEKELQEYVKFIDKKPAEEIPKYYANADMAFITLKKNLISDQILPAKLQSYFACGIPILGCADGEIKKVIEESEAGFCVSSGNVEKLKEKIQECMKLGEDELQLMRKKAIEFHNENYNQQVLLDKFEEEVLK